MDRFICWSLSRYVIYCLALIAILSCTADSAGFGSVEIVKDVKHLKREIKAHNNVLVVFGKTKKSTTKWDKILSEVSSAMIGRASILIVDCSAQRKVCKTYKAAPNPVALHHYHDGKFNSLYTRKQSVKSLMAFLEDPTGDIPWDEDPAGESVRHLANHQEMVKLMQRAKQPVLLMFYAPWCGYCKRLKPEYAAAASEANNAVLAAMDVDKPGNDVVRQQFNITGYPTLVYIKDARITPYGGGYTKDSIISWLNDPSPPKPPEPERDWSEEKSDVTFLTDNNFQTVLANQASALVMFYAPWCGHCKAMKPAYQAAASALKRQGISGMLAAIDASKYTQAAKKFSVQGFPSVKYFQNGEFKFNLRERTEEKLVQFMKDPKEPEAAPAETTWWSQPSQVQHLGEANFTSFLKRKRRTLVMFYAPWCGHCKNAKPEFTTAASQLADVAPKAALAAVDCTEHGQLCQRAGVSGYPTLLHYYYGKAAKPYTGERRAAGFVKFMTSEEKLEL